MNGIKLFLLGVLISLTFVSAQAAPYSFATSSRLSTGNWIKIRIPSTGIYKLSYSDLVNMGIQRPEKAKIYGYGGQALDMQFLSTKEDDLPQVAIWRETGSDNVFGSGDYILFYGRGPVSWSYDTPNKEYVQSNNPYSTYGYYFVSDNDEEVLTMATRASSTKTPAVTLTSYDYYDVHEKELYNFLLSGSEFYGEPFYSTTPQSFSFNIPGITQEDGVLTVDLVAKVDPSYKASFTAQIGTNEMFNTTMPTSSPSDSYTKARSGKTTVKWTGAKSENTTVSITYKRTGSETARLNYIRLNCKSTLGLYGSYTFFRNADAVNSNVKYLFAGTSSKNIIWDVTSPVNVVQQETVSSGNDLSFTTQQSSIKEYVILNPSATFEKPTILGKVKNQNLHGLDTAQFIIITQPSLKSQAEVLANIHRVRDGLTVSVVEPEEIYNEFSSGTPDATAYRWFMKMIQETNRGGDYLLLFGDGTYDNRLLTAANKDKTPFSFILTYQSPSSISAYTSYVSDDYFGFLDDNEGPSIGNNVLDVGIGRIPVSTLEDARANVAKILTYMNNKNPGTWKNNIVFFADDEDNNLHMSQSDELAERVLSKNPEFIVNKIHIDAYKQVTSATGSSYPDAKNKLMNLIDNGQLIVNYTGHGNTVCLTGEDMLNETDINNFHTDKLALWVTATCDFTRFDDVEPSAGEKLLLNKKSGAIASFSTTRIVNSLPNFQLNKILLDNLFLKNNGKRLRLGDIMKNTKIALGGGDNKLNFALFGDPVLYLAYPEYQIKVNTFKEKEVTTLLNDTISAMETITVTGQIIAPGDTLAKSFNGTLMPTIFDLKEKMATLNNDKTADSPLTFYDRTKVLYSGNCKVKNGLFSFSFMVPKDNSYSYESGLMNLYAFDDSHTNEAQGYYDRFVVGGTSTNAPVDTTGPAIAVFLNSTHFKDGDKVNEAPLLIAYVDDSSGINRSGSGIGHDITLIIDGNTSDPINLNPYYENTGVGNQGVLRYQLEALPAGNHTLYFKIWDIQNNSSSIKINFEVVKDLEPEIFNAYTIYDKIADKNTFYVEHDRSTVGMNIRIEVLDYTGHEVWSVEESSFASESIYTYSWDRISHQGNKLPVGIYLYRVYVRSDGSKEAVKSEKLIINKQ
ncbi:MAG: type IX secretion system sortase PorU [Bacteroidales bacterium]|nr:type IX secretion system sortase PorU [Bacteroidales bacterium]